MILPLPASCEQYLRLYLGIIVLSAADCKLKLAGSFLYLHHCHPFPVENFFVVLFCFFSNNAEFWLHSILEQGTLYRRRRGEAGCLSMGL